MTLPSTCMTFSRSVANNRILKISGYHYLMFSRRLSTNQAKKKKDRKPKGLLHAESVLPPKVSKVPPV